MTFNLVHRLVNHTGFKKYFANTAWLMAEKVFRLLAGLLVGVWVVRYLGPEKFGMLSYVLAFTSLFAPLGKLGFDGIVSRDIAIGEDNTNTLVSTAIAVKFFGSFFIVFGVPIYMLLSKDDPLYFYLGLIVSIIYLLKSFEVIEFYFRAKVKAKLISLANISGLVISSILKVIFILSGYSLVYFAFANIVEATFVTLILLYMFSNEPINISFKNINFAKGCALLKESWPMIFSGFFALVYLNIDQVMIEGMLSSYDVGQYSAAVRISSLWYFIPLTLGWSVQTAIVNARKRSRELYYRRLQLLFTSMALLAYMLVLPVSYFSHEIVDVLFGKDYSLAGSILAVHIFASIFVFIGSIRGLWVTNESYFKFALFSNVSAGGINIVLNYLWLPQYGVIGAAWATLISYSFTFLFSGVFFGPARKIVRMQLRALLILDLPTLLTGVKI